MEGLSMKDINLEGLNNIKADKALIDKAVHKVMNNSNSKNYFNIKRSLAMAASLMVISGSIGLYFLHNKGNSGIETASKVVADTRTETNKPLVEDKVTANEPIADSKEPSTKPVEESKVTVTASKPILDKKVTPIKPADSKVTPNTEVEDSKVTGDKPVAGNKVTNNTVKIPAITLDTSSEAQAKMSALVVYKGKIYIKNNTLLDSSKIEGFLD